LFGLSEFFAFRELLERGPPALSGFYKAYCRFRDMLGSYVELLYFLFDFLVSPRKAGISRLI
jgi:hypothetical protein